MDTLKWIFRFLLVVVILFALGIGIYYGLPYLYNQWVKPVEEQSVQIKDLKAQQEQSKDVYLSRLEGVQKQLDALVLQQDKDKEELAKLNKMITDTQSWQRAQEEISARLIAAEYRLDQLEAELDKIDMQFIALDKNTQEQKATISALSEDIEQQATPLAVMNQEMMLVKVMELVTRSRLSLIDSNYGLAQNDLQAACTLLSRLQSLLPFNQAQSVQDIERRLELAITNMESNPSLAEKDLDIAWQMLVQGLPGSINEVPIAPTPSPLESSTPTPAATELL